MISLCLMILSGAFLVLPGVLWVSCLQPQRPLAMLWVIGPTLGLAGATYVAFLISYGDLRWFPLVWLGIWLVSVVAWWQRRPRVRLIGWPRGTSAGLLTVLLLVAVTRAAVPVAHAAMGEDLPRESDLAFHSLLTRKIAVAHHMIHDWRPFSQITLNYPTGCHTLAAVCSLMSGVEESVVLALAIPLLGVLSAAAIYGLALSATRCERTSLIAALAYGMWALLGSIDYANWGGVPNEMAMLILTILLGLLIEERGRGDLAIVSLLMASLILTHHHVMATGAIILAAIGAFALHRQSDRKVAGRVLALAAGACLLTCMYTVPYALRVASLGNTNALISAEGTTPLSNLPGRFGWLFSLAVIAGALCVLLRARTARNAGDRAPAWQVHWVIPLSCATLALVYVLTAYACPFITGRLSGKAMLPFTPSRFLTDLAYPASVFAAIGFVRMGERLHLSFAVMFALGLIGSLSLLPAWLDMRWEYPQHGMLDACKWIRETSPPDTVVANTDPWISYLTFRRCGYVPIPASEPAQGPEEVSRLLRSIDDTIRRGVPADPSVRFLVLIASPRLGHIPRGATLWRNDEGCEVRLFWPPIATTSPVPQDTRTRP